MKYQQIEQDGLASPLMEEDNTKGVGDDELKEAILQA